MSSIFLFIIKIKIFSELFINNVNRFRRFYMVLFENTQKTFDLEEIDVDYEMLMVEDIPVEKPEVVLYFNKGRSLDSIDDILMVVPMKLDGIDEEKQIVISYSPVEFDSKFNIEKLNDDIYEVEELPDGYMVTVEDLAKLSKVFKARFEQSVTYPFDNTSKNDTVNKYLEKDNIDLGTKIAKYINDLVYKVDEYKTIHQSWLNRKTREDKKKAEEVKRRAGRTDLQSLLDDIKKLPGVERVLTGEMRPGARFANRWRVFASYNKMVKMKPVPTKIVIEILTDTAGKHFVCKVLDDAFNGSEQYSPMSVIRWIKNKLNIKQAPIAEDPVEDDDDDFDLTSLGLEESKAPRLKNGDGKFRKCSKCGKIITAPDDCDFTENEDCLCAACGRSRTKSRSKGNEFMEATRILKNYGYKIIK